MTAPNGPVARPWVRLGTERAWRPAGATSFLRSRWRGLLAASPGRIVYIAQFERLARVDSSSLSANDVRPLVPEAAGLVMVKDTASLHAISSGPGVLIIDASEIESIRWRPFPWPSVLLQLQQGGLHVFFIGPIDGVRFKRALRGEAAPPVR